ncbi:MAG TPA: C39 family peptidase [Polyangiaceae bacterium]|nr:C39 family peptidase [Polyangiaceae bacterium]
MTSEKPPLDGQTPSQRPAASPESQNPQDSPAQDSQDSPSPESSTLGVRVLAQPGDAVCGPTCLHAIYRFFDHEVPISRVVDEIPPLPDGGTLAVFLGRHALKEGFAATIYTSNLQTFDPTWFRKDVKLAEKLRAQMQVKKDPKLRLACQAYLEFLEAGGKIRMRTLSLDLVRGLLDRGVPVLAGLSATYLYECPRELPDGTPDDVAGSPSGHFVILQGYDADREHVLIADPWPDNPEFSKPYYSVEISRLLAAVHLGIVTYDANLLVIEPPHRP